MAQLLNKNINTLKLTNSFLRNFEEEIVVLRTDEVNTPNFSKLSIYKDVVLDLARSVDAERINDIAISKVSIGYEKQLDGVKNRLILVLEGQASFIINDNRFTPDVGDLIWLNEDLLINNNSNNISLFLIIDFDEFLL